MDDPQGIVTGALLPAEPEERLLRFFFSRKKLALRLAAAPGGWRTLSPPEFMRMGLTQGERRRVEALQELVGRGYAALAIGKLASSNDVARVFAARLAGLATEVMIAVAVDGQNNFIGEATVAVGGSHGLSITARDILRPMIRIGASAMLLAHNHPSGDPTPSAEDILMTRALAEAGEVVGLPLVDHVIVASRGRGFASLLDLGLIDGGSPRARLRPQKTINESERDRT